MKPEEILKNYSNTKEFNDVGFDKGISSMIEYSDSSNIFYLQGKVSFLNDLTGEGVLEKRKYFTYSLSSDIFINKLFASVFL